MKKRTVKDFIALYAPEDEEKLVLIQDGISADKTFLDTYWAAHTHALAMADVQTGQAISGRCYLSWPLTDKERDARDYSKQFTKGQIYRIKARGWKGDALSEPQWYVTEVLEEGEFEPMFSACEAKLAGKKIALFGSYGWGDGEWMRSWEKDCSDAGVNLVCESVTCCEAPDDAALTACRELGKTLAK